MYPVGIEPAAVGLGVGLDTYETELRTNPFALTHGELAAAIGPFLAVQAVGETDHGFAAMSHAGLGVGNGEAEVDVFMDAGLVVNLILGGRLQRGNELLVLGLAAVGILAVAMNSSAGVFCNSMLGTSQRLAFGSWLLAIGCLYV